MTAACFLLFTWSAAAQSAKPVKLECESLSTPLGMDTAKPQLSWKIQDSRSGARQTAYQVQVASKAELLLGGQGDVWDSGRVESDNSLGVTYGGPALEPSKRYYWRVVVWDQDGKASAASETSWWETGLLQQENWKAKWIGYEEPELRHVRESGAEWITNADGEAPKDATSTKHEFRLHFSLAKPVRRGTLYATGQDSAGAWLNGKQVMEVRPVPPWRQMPWKTYAIRDVSSELRAGQNVLAIEVVHYLNGGGNRQRVSQTPMNAVLYVEAADGTFEVFKSTPEGWRAALNAGGSWQTTEFDDSSWNGAIRYVAPASGFENAALGNPWPTGAVKSLRQTFEIAKPVASARMYATALGGYELLLNGRRVGDEVLAPGDRKSVV
jgi:alpha-L-rhamnosidase